MKILSYNIYGVKDTTSLIPKWNERQENIERILNRELKDSEMKVCCFQEVNQNNMQLLEYILINNNFKILEKFSMKTRSDNQYNIVAIKDELDIKINYVYCLPHGKDTEYTNKKYLIGNIHTDYISTEGKVKGVIKTLNYMDTINADYKILLGDMNMVSHMSEVYNVLKQNSNYVTLSRNKNFDVSDNSWHGYGTKEAEASTIHGEKICKKLLKMQYIRDTNHASKIYCEDREEFIKAMNRIKIHKEN